LDFNLFRNGGINYFCSFYSQDVCYFCRMSSISKYFKFTLKPEQVRVFQDIQAFVSHQNQKVFILKGYAGTGKTTLMSGLIRWMESEGVSYRLLATTGRAAKILSDLTRKKAQTIHSAIYRYQGFSEDIAQIKKVSDGHGLHLQFSLFPVMSSDKTVYIIDESSMLSDVADEHGSFARFGTGDLLQDLFSFDSLGKFIFIGDPCQLPPVRQQFSPALMSDYLKTKYRINAIERELTEIMRQKGTSGIAEASLHLRQQFYKNTPVKYANLIVKGYDNIQIHASQLQLIQQYQKVLLKKGDAYTTMICQTNRHCKEINTLVRERLFDSSEPLQEGDLLLVTQNNLLTGLLNGDLVKIISKGKIQKRAGLHFQKVQLKRQGEEDVIEQLLILDLLEGTVTNLSQDQHKALIIDFIARMKKKNIRTNSKSFEVMMMSDAYLNALRTVHGYAITCHKSQGGEWEEVFLYLDNKIHGIPKPGIYQWWYTAITRAKKTLHISQDWYVK
jgi:ATP-dependent exoDNAse (exonuclease V) alpha subunit